MLNINLETIGEKRMLQLNKLEEFRKDAYESSIIYKENTKAWHVNTLVKNEFKLRKQVLLFNSRLKLFLRKPKSRWFRRFVII